MSFRVSPNVSYPGVYVKEISRNLHSIVGVHTTFTAFIGLTSKGPLNKATKISSFSDFEKVFGGLSEYHNLGYAINHFFLNGGNNAIIVSVGNDKTVTSDKIIGDKNRKSGIYCLDTMDDFNILCIPPYDETETTAITVYQKALEYCKLRRAILLVDPPKNWSDVKSVTRSMKNFFRDENAAIYFPRVKIKEKSDFVPCGIIAGIIARTDSSRGVWKAPAGTNVVISGIEDLMVHLSDDETGVLTMDAVNCMKQFPAMGFVVWGSRTMNGTDILASEWKYLAVRRTALFIEESLYRGLKWTVFESNGVSLWSSIRSNVDSFMNNLFRQGAFSAPSSDEAYFVKCDNTTTTQSDIDKGIVNIIVGFAPLKPAEFVIIKIQLFSHVK